MVLVTGQHVSSGRRARESWKEKVADLHLLASALSSGKSGAVLDYESSLLSLAALP